LSGTRLDFRGRLLIAWFGPRGLSSLLLILLPVFAGATGSQQLFEIACFVVILSVAVHGGSLMFLKRDSFPVTIREENITVVANDLPRDIQVSSKPVENETPHESAVRISVTEVRQLQHSQPPLLILDLRSDRTLQTTAFHAHAALR